MRPNPLQCQRWAVTARRHHFRPLVELLETRIVPSVVDHSAGFASHSDLSLNGSALVNGSVAQLTSAANQAGSFFTNSKVEDGQFTVDFTFKLQSPATAAGGFSLTFNDDAAGPAALGERGAAMGFTGLRNSLAFFFEPSTNATGLLISGIPETAVSLQGSGINLQSQDRIHVRLAYNGSTVMETLVDTATGATFSHSFNVNISREIGSQFAYVGFTGGTGSLGSTETVDTFFGSFGSAGILPVSVSGVTQINGVEEQPLQNVIVGTFTGPSSSTGLTATIDWGDGTTSAGTIVGSGQNGVFVILGSHTYAEDGETEMDLVDAIPITVTLSNANGNTATIMSVAHISEEAAAVFYAAQGNYAVAGQELQPISGTVATFSAFDGASAGDFSATIDWGDGTTSAGTISGNKGSFTVMGTHSYAEDGDNENGFADIFPVNVTLSNGNGASNTVASRAYVGEESLAIATAQGGFTINTQELQFFTAPVASFTSSSGGR